MAAGEPDFATPGPVCDAAVEALRNGFTKYTATPGIKELREAIARKLKRENGVEAALDEIVVSCGAKHSLYNTAMVLLGPGDEALVFAPYWMTYVDQIELAGAKAVIVPTCPESGFVPRIEDLEAAVTPKTRAIFVNSPCNPTGGTFPRLLLEQIGRLAVEHDLWIVSDEIYEHLVYDGEHVSALSLPEEIRQRTVFISGCSKTYAMTGWRIGFAYAPKAVATAMSSLQDQVTSNANSIAQHAAVAAFDLPHDEVAKMRDAFRGRRQLMVERLNAIEGVQVASPNGAFYVFPDVSQALGNESDADFCQRLLETAGVAAIPGSVFGGPGHIRLSYAASEIDIERGVERIAEVLHRPR